MELASVELDVARVLGDGVEVDAAGQVGGGYYVLEGGDRPVGLGAVLPGGTAGGCLGGCYFYIGICVCI